jgi:hypothetical protein
MFAQKQITRTQLYESNYDNGRSNSLLRLWHLVLKTVESRFMALNYTVI